MFALVALALGSEDHTAFDGAIQFDALQATIPAIPGTPTAPVPSTNINICLATCDATYTAAIQAAVRATFPANTGATITVSCGPAGGCTSGTARSLLQVGTAANIAITGATVAELNVLANNIIAGNLVNVGIAPSTVVTGATVTPASVSGPQAIANLGGNAVLPPINPSSPAGSAICGNPTTFRRLLCLPGINSAQTALQRCAAAQTTIAVNLALQGIGSAAAPGAICCGCNVARRSLQQLTTGAQVTATAATTTVAQLCAAAPRGYPGCGKRGSKKGLLGLLGLLGLIPLILCLLICCLCCLRRKRRGQAMLFSQTAVPAPIPAPLPVPVHVHAEPHLHAGPDFHVHP